MRDKEVWLSMAQSMGNCCLVAFSKAFARPTRGKREKETSQEIEEERKKERKKREKEREEKEREERRRNRNFACISTWFFYSWSFLR